MSRCECCQQETALVVPVVSVDPAAPVVYDLLCPVCAAVVEQVRRLDVREWWPYMVTGAVPLSH